MRTIAPARRRAMRRQLVGSCSVAALGLAGGMAWSGAAQAACPAAVAGTATITDNTCPNFNFSAYPAWTNLLVTTTGSMTPSSGTAIYNNGVQVGSITINGAATAAAGQSLMGINGGSAGQMTWGSTATITIPSTTYYGISLQNLSSFAGFENNGSVSSNYALLGIISTNSGSIVNNGSITVPSEAVYLQNSVLTGNIVNTGTIHKTGVSRNNPTFLIYTATVNGDLVNSGSLTAAVGATSSIFGIVSGATVTGALRNSGTIAGTTYGIDVRDSTISGGIVNTGAISGNFGIRLIGASSVPTITNAAGASSTAVSLGQTSAATTFHNYGTVTGGVGLGAFSTLNLYAGARVIGSTSGSGSAQVNVNGDFTTEGDFTVPTFAVLGGRTALLHTITATTTSVANASVLQIGNGGTAGSVAGNNGVTRQGRITVAAQGQPVDTRYKWNAVWNGADVDLVVDAYYGALPGRTLATVAQTRDAVLGLMHQRYALLNAVMEYDCAQFDKYGVCLSMQARATGFGAQSTGAGAVNIALRLAERFRVGGFIDYQANVNSPAIGGYPFERVQAQDNRPTFGGYAGYSASGYSGRGLDSGLQLVVSGGANPGKVTVSRAMTPDMFGYLDAEPGSGSARLDAWFVRAMAGYGVEIGENASIMPYGGVRYTDVTRGAYAEKANPIVTQPLAYDAYYERLLTGFGGLQLRSMLTRSLGVVVGLGAEADIARHANNVTAQTLIPDLPFLSLDHGGSWNTLRPSATAGAFYNLSATQRLFLNGGAGQQAWTTRTFASGALGYQMAF